MTGRHYATPVALQSHPTHGIWRGTTVTASLFDDIDRGWRAYVREWVSPSSYGPPGTITVTVTHGIGPTLRVLSTHVAPPGTADIPAAIAAAVEAINKEKNS